MRRQVGEARKARTERAHVACPVAVEADAPPCAAPRSPAGQAAGAAEVPGEEPVGRPLADPRQRDERARAPRRRGAGRARRGRGPRAPARRRTRPSAARTRRATISSGGRRRAARGSGTRTRRHALTPKASIRRFRMLKAARSEICCAVIEVTSVSKGSGTSGGRRPRRGGTTSASTGSAAAKPAKASRSNGAAQVAAHRLRELGVAAVDRHAARRRLDAHLAPAEHPVEPVLVPEVGEVGAERAVALGREPEVERLRKRDGERRNGSPRSARRGRPAPRGRSARPRRAKTRSAASAAQRSE